MDKKRIALPPLDNAMKQVRGRMKMNRPDFDTMLDASGMDGLPQITEGTAEEIANEEVSDIMRMIKENRKNNAEHFRDVDAGEFWFCVCFQSRSQKEQFIERLLQKYAPHDTIDRFGDKYLSGLEFAEMLSIEIDLIELEVKKSRLAPKNLRETEVI